MNLELLRVACMHIQTSFPAASSSKCLHTPLTIFVLNNYQYSVTIIHISETK